MQSAPDHKAIARSFTDAVVQKRIADAAKMLAPHFQYHAPGFPRLNPGPREWELLMGSFMANSPQLQFTINEQVAEGDTVVTHYTWQTVHEREFMGMPPTGKALTVHAVSIHRLANGQITEAWVLDDYLSLFRQLGAVPLSLLQETMVVQGVNEARQVPIPTP